MLQHVLKDDHAARGELIAMLQADMPPPVVKKGINVHELAAKKKKNKQDWQQVMQIIKLPPSLKVFMINHLEKNFRK